MEFFIDIFNDALIDTLKLVPFLFVTYWVMELIEHMASDKSRAAIERAGHAGPLVGAVLGALPQCGFSAAASTLYAGRVITVGTLIAVFLSTSDEMLPIFIAEQVDPIRIVQIIGLKALIGVIMGFVFDLIVRLTHHAGDGKPHIDELCERDHCHCDDEEEHHSPLRSAIHHTLQVTLFIFLISLVLGGAIEWVGEEAIASFMQVHPTLSVIAASVVGLIPNCGASVVLTELYLEGTLSFGAAMGGLLVSAGIGLLVLVRTNRHAKQNLTIIGVLFLTGVIWGWLLQLLGVAL